MAGRAAVIWLCSSWVELVTDEKAEYQQYRFTWLRAKVITDRSYSVTYFTTELHETLPGIFLQHDIS